MGDVLLTARLRLREIEESDEEALLAILGDGETMRFWPKPFDRAAVREWIASMRARIERFGRAYWTAVLRDSGEIVGQVGVLDLDIPYAEGVRNEPSLGYIIARPYWRRGFALEGAEASMRWARERGEDRMTALIRPENVPSIGVARRLGLVRECVVRYKGYDHAVYAGVTSRSAPAARP